MRNARTRNVYYESFRNDYAASGFLWQMEFFHRLVTSANLAYGRTIQPTMLAPALGFAAGLGPKPWRRAGMEVELFVTQHAAVFMSATFTEFQYGAGPIIVGTSGFVGNEPFSQPEITTTLWGRVFSSDGVCAPAVTLMGGGPGAGRHVGRAPPRHL